MDLPLDPRLWIAIGTVALLTLMGVAAHRASVAWRARRREALSAPILRYVPDGLAEIGLPPGGFLVYWPAEGRYAHYVEAADPVGAELVRRFLDGSIAPPHGPSAHEIFLRELLDSRAAPRPREPRAIAAAARGRLRVVRPERAG